MVTKSQLTRGEKREGWFAWFSPPPKKKQECSDRFVPQLEARNGTWGLTGEWDMQMRRCKLFEESRKTCQHTPREGQYLLEVGVGSRKPAQ